MEREIPVLYKRKEECCGCTACYAICPKEAISMVEDEEGFKAVHEYLVDGGESCMAGFVLKNTLSDNGGVTRGICKMDEGNNLTEVVETKNIVKTATGAEADGVAVDVNSLVSMNMCGD